MLSGSNSDLTAETGLGSISDLTGLVSNADLTGLVSNSGLVVETGLEFNSGLVAETGCLASWRLGEGWGDEDTLVALV